jgi:hypothetical protein
MYLLFPKVPPWCVAGQICFTVQKYHTYLTYPVFVGSRCYRRGDEVYSRSQAIYESFAIYSSTCKYSRMYLTNAMLFDIRKTGENHVY